MAKPQTTFFLVGASVGACISGEQPVAYGLKGVHSFQIDAQRTCTDHTHFVLPVTTNVPIDWARLHYPVQPPKEKGDAASSPDLGV